MLVNYDRDYFDALRRISGKPAADMQERTFLATAHRLLADHEAQKRAQKVELTELLTMLEQTTQSRAIAERCAKAKAVLA
jgi:hypothetical protein